MLSQNEIAFIQAHANEDPSSLAFLGKKFPEIDLPKVLFQIQARQKLKSKLPTWVAQEALFFPPQLSLEQASSEKTALFKAQLIQGKILDLTGGMGVDSWAFGQITGNEVTYLEQNGPLKEMSVYNHSVLGLESMQHFHAEGMEFLSKNNEPFDWIYLDPARRDEKGKKVFLLSDCSPNAVAVLPYLNEMTGMLLKTSPMLDIDLCMKELGGVEEVHVVCIKNEIKELIFKKTEHSSLEPKLHVWEIGNKPELIFSATKTEEKVKKEALGHVSTFLYEPHAGILKAGFFKSIQTNGVVKIASNTHLYTSEKPVLDFPGRGFEVIGIGKLESKWILPLLENGKANITCRNAPLSPEEVRKKLKVSDGGEYTLFVFKNLINQTQCAVCKKILDHL